MDEAQRYLRISTDVVVVLVVLPLSNLLQRDSACHPFSFLWQYLHCSGTVRATLTSIPFHRCVAREKRGGGGRRRGPRVNPFIYLFMCHGGARADEGVREARLIAGACIEPGIPRERPYRDEGNGKSHGELARGYSTPSPGLSRSSLGIYGVFTYSHV